MSREWAAVWGDGTACEYGGAPGPAGEYVNLRTAGGNKGDMPYRNDEMELPCFGSNFRVSTIAD